MRVWAGVRLTMLHKYFGGGALGQELTKTRISASIFLHDILRPPWKRAQI